MRGKYRSILAACTAVGAMSLVGLLLDLSYEKKVWKPPQIVTIEGEGAALMRMPPAWKTASVGERPTACMLSEGDIVWVKFGQTAEGEAFLPYHSTDGSQLLVSAEEDRFSLAEKVVALGNEDQISWDWLEQVEVKDLANLRLLSLSGEISEASELSALRRLAEINPSVGLGFNSCATLHQLLPIFDPRWLILLGDELVLTPEDLALLSEEKHLETLWMGQADLECLDFLAPLSTLRSLLITYNSSTELPVSRPLECRNLESLTVLGSGMTDLAIVQNLKNLAELHLFECENLTDIAAVTGLSALHTLNLARCTALNDLSSLQSLENLKWLSLPPNTTPSQLVAVIRDHPDLRVLEMIDCESITDLGPLRRLQQLEYLVISSEVESYLPLRELKTLRFLGLPEGAFEEAAEDIRELEKAMPACQVVAVEKFCLGSGWILILFPLVAGRWALSSWLQ